MTNNMIILTESVRLMKQGILKGTGQFVEVETEPGKTEKLELPEEIHTFQGWKARGYSVRKGEKSNIRIAIWKYSEGKRKIDTDTDCLTIEAESQGHGKMFMKVSAFFTASQVDVIVNH